MRFALVVMALTACSDGGGVAPPIALSVQLADGRTCRDAGATTVELPHVLGDAGPLAFVCYDLELPRSVTISGLPIEDVDVVALSAMSAPLYEGHLHVAGVVSGPTPSATVVLYAEVAR